MRKLEGVVIRHWGLIPYSTVITWHYDWHLSLAHLRSQFIQLICGPLSVKEAYFLMTLLLSFLNLNFTPSTFMQEGIMERMCFYYSGLFPTVDTVCLGLCTD